MKGFPGSWIIRWVCRALLALVGVTILLVLVFRWVAPPTTAFMLEERIGRWVGGGSATAIRYRWIDWNGIAPPMRLAVVAAEDQKFPRHWGFDLESIVEAVEHSGVSGRPRGASTITQQVARNLFLWSGRSYLRKGLEAYFTILLELCWPKRRTLEMYLNIAEFGEGIYGVGAAAPAFFGKRPRELHAEEAALLAAVLPNPSRFHVRNPSAYVRERASWIGVQMGRLGGVSYLRDL